MLTTLTMMTFTSPTVNLIILPGDYPADPMYGK